MGMGQGYARVRYRYRYVFLTLQKTIPVGQVDRFSRVTHMGTLREFQPRFQQVSNPLGRHYQLHTACTTSIHQTKLCKELGDMVVRHR